MKVKKILLFLTLMLLVCYDIKVLSTTSKMTFDPNSQTLFFDNRIDDIHQKLMRECNFTHKDNFRNIDRHIFSLMVSECDKYDLPYSLFFSVVDRESGFRFIPNSEGSSAMGYMQLMPKTFSINAKKLNIKKHTPENNIKVGAYHLHDLFLFWNSRYHDDKTAWTWTLSQYAVGLGGMQVVDSNGISYQIPESTKSGINKILRNYNENL